MAVPAHTSSGLSACLQPTMKVSRVAPKTSSGLASSSTPQSMVEEDEEVAPIVELTPVS